MSSNLLPQQLRAKLTTQFGSATVADEETGYLMATMFDWTPESISPARVDSLLAFAFGNRVNADNAAALPAPGPVNEAIARATSLAYAVKPVLVYAQWEVATLLTSMFGVPAEHVVSVGTPVLGTNGKYTAASMDAVVTAALAAAGAGGLGTVGVIAHRDAVKHAVERASFKGANAFGLKGIALPDSYDESAAQPAYRRRDLFQLTDLGMRLGDLRLALIAEQYPTG